MEKQRKIVLGVAAALTVLAVLTQPDRPVAAAPEPAVAEAAAAREPVAHIEMPAREAMPAFARDPFSAEAPASKPAKAASALAPAAPVNPYRFAGELRTGGATQRFLARGDDTFEAKAGDALDDGYTVESVSAKEIVLAHSSGVRQALSVGTPAWDDPARSRVVQVAQSGRSAPAVAPESTGLLGANVPSGYFFKANSQQ
jgi:hypothetical protein